MNPVSDRKTDFISMSNRSLDKGFNISFLYEGFVYLFLFGYYAPKTWFPPSDPWADKVLLKSFDGAVP